MKLRKLAVLLGICLFLPVAAVNAAPTSAEDARAAVMHWLAMDAKPLGADLGAEIGEVRTFTDGSGYPLYHIVYLTPAGFVIVAGDDLVEPIIGFLPEGTYDNSFDNPLAALVDRDVPFRVSVARQEEQDAKLKGRLFAPSEKMTQSQQKWKRLVNPPLEAPAAGLPSISDLRVGPLVQSKWNQMDVEGIACYNYYTPPGAAGSATNYPCGCVATSASQLIRYHSYPNTGVGTGQFTYAVNKELKTGNLRGGDDSGGVYKWSDMPMIPDGTTTTAQRQAIGRLIWDVGIASKMEYTSLTSSANDNDMVTALKNVFRYGNAIFGGSEADNSPTIPVTTLIAMMNPNLDASFPVILGVTQSDGTGGHSIIGDGYGYNLSTLYHHINMGWGGAEDAWYNLPDINAGTGSNYKIVGDVVYNIYPTGSGEIISGRVTDRTGSPVSGATVTAIQSTGASYSSTTNSRGIYAIAKIPSASSYVIKAAKEGYYFAPRSISTLTSTAGTNVVGNVWGVNFAAQPLPVDSTLLLLLGD